jgi:para-nitrobenzyl esterase
MAVSAILQVTWLCLVVTFCEGKSIYAWTNQGLVRGTTVQDDVQAFYGVPFAAQPERFKPPQPPSFRFQFIFDATTFGNQCPQNIPAGGYQLNEDCLNVNIFAPKHAHFGSNLPVFVYWWGGSFLRGSNSEPTNQPQALANEADIIVVIPNVRLGALGFLYIDELKEADDYKNNKVNFAMLDMISALTWVKKKYCILWRRSYFCHYWWTQFRCLYGIMAYNNPPKLELV